MRSQNYTFSFFYTRNTRENRGASAKTPLVFPNISLLFIDGLGAKAHPPRGVRALLTSAFAPQSFLPYSIQMISTKQAEKNPFIGKLPKFHAAFRPRVTILKRKMAIFRGQGNHLEGQK